MAQAYCIKCKQKNELTETTSFYASNGVPMERGKCSKCGTNTTRMLSKEERQALKDANKV